MIVNSLITDEQEKKRLRDGYAAEYKRLTGETLACLVRTLSLQNYGPTAKRHLLDITSAYMNMDKTWITSSSRKPELVKIRQMIVYLLTEMKIIREEIYPIVGYAEGSTVTHSVQKIKDLLSIDKTFKEEYLAYKKHCVEQLKLLIRPINKLTQEQEIAIISSLKKGGITQKELAEIYGVHRNVIVNLVSKNKKKEETINKQKKFIRDGY
jgi:hypothetical protein